MTQCSHPSGSIQMSGIYCSPCWATAICGAARANPMIQAEIRVFIAISLVTTMPVTTMVGGADSREYYQRLRFREEPTATCRGKSTSAVSDDQFSTKRVTPRSDDPHPAQITGLHPVGLHVDRVQVIGLADHLARQATRLFEQHADLLADHRVLGRLLLFGDQRLQALQAVILDVFGKLVPFSRRGAGAGGVLEAVGVAVI